MNMLPSLYRLTRAYYAISSALVAAAMLGAAYTLQYGFDFHPCHLCLLQRYPYMAVIALGLAGSFLLKKPAALPWIIGLIALSYAVAAGLGFYHTGVEYGIFTGPTDCTDQTSDTTSLEALRASIMEAPLVSCNQPSVIFLGLSLAFWNALLATGLALDALAALWVIRKGRQHD